MFKHKYEINLYEFRTSATSPIDVVETDDEVFAADDYINGCEIAGADADWIDMLMENEVIVYKVY